MSPELFNDGLQLFAGGVAFGLLFAIFLGMLLAVVAQVRAAVGWGREEQ